MPRSRHADAFNHDDEARGYDRDVRNEADPIRAGYDALLDWVAARAAVGPTSRVLELGSGTGNLTARLPQCREIVCVDVSGQMIDVARSKLRDRREVRFVQSDLLEYFDEDVDRRGPGLDAVVSSYAIHHLLEDEKAQLFSRIARRLAPGGRVACGDLMFESAAARTAVLAGYRREGREDLAESIEEEFFWDLERSARCLRELGLTVETRRFSELSWGVACIRAA